MMNRGGVIRGRVQYRVDYWIFGEFKENCVNGSVQSSYQADPSRLLAHYSTPNIGQMVVLFRIAKRGGVICQSLVLVNQIPSVLCLTGPPSGSSTKTKRSNAERAAWPEERSITNRVELWRANLDHRLGLERKRRDVISYRVDEETDRGKLLRRNVALFAVAGWCVGHSKSDCVGGVWKSAFDNSCRFVFHNFLLWDHFITIQRHTLDDVTLRENCNACFGKSSSGVHVYLCVSTTNKLSIKQPLVFTKHKQNTTFCLEKIHFWWNPPKKSFYFVSVSMIKFIESFALNFLVNFSPASQKMCQSTDCFIRVLRLNNRNKINSLKIDEWIYLNAVPIKY